MVCFAVPRRAVSDAPPCLLVVIGLYELSNGQLILSDYSM